MKIQDKLLDKSQEAFIMAIEIYNKPSLKYRVEGFSFFICNAWELMLKAYMIDKLGDSSIYYDDNPNRTISLENCIRKIFTNNKDPLRINLEKIIELRLKSYDNMSNDEKLKTNEQLSKGITKIMAVAESYPELKANENFKDLSNQLIKVEDDIANSRKYYNGTVRIYNNKVEMFPSNIIAKIFGYKTKNMFEASETERENVKVEL